MTAEKLTTMVEGVVFDFVPDETMSNNGIKKEQFPGLDNALVENYVPEHLQEQLSYMIDLIKDYNEKLPIDLKLSEADLTFLSTFYLGFLTDRTRRSEETQTPEYKKVVEKANRLIPMDTFMVLCMDGRVKPIHTNGFSAGIGSAIRTPAGMLNEFFRIDGEIQLDPKSDFARLLLQKVEKHESFAEVLDSHWACAARILEEASTGSHPKDNGVLRDVLTKKEMIGAAKDFLKKEGHEGKNVAFVQTTFNPYTGFLYMGLERDESIAKAKRNAREKAIEKSYDPDEEEKYAEYDKATLKELIDSNDIISTGALVNDESIREAFDKRRLNCSWQKDYVNSAIQFWDNIEVLVDEVGPTIKERVLELYPYLSENSREAKDELDERVMLLLTNSFNAYLHNGRHNEEEYLAMDDHAYEELGYYEYGQHMEEGVKISEGGHPPYDIMMFVVYNGDLENLPDRLELASGIVRSNRARSKNPVKDPTRPDRNPERVERLPVPVVMQEIVRDRDKVKVSEQDWKNLETIKWDDIPRNWNTITEREFTEYLISKGVGNVLLRVGIEKMRQRMARIYEPQTKTAPHLKGLFKSVLPILCDGDRITHAIIPLIKVGREDKNGNHN